MTITKSVRLSKKGQFVIPKEIREGLQVKEGDTLLIRLEGSQAVISRAQQLAHATRGILKGSWGVTHKRIDRYLDRERESWEH